MSERRVIAVVGISGVGKSTALEQTRALVKFEHLQASALIKAERVRREQVAIDHDALRDANIDENQELLSQGFRHAAPESGLIVLDGHTVVDTPNGLVEIPPEVFHTIGVSRFIVLTARPEEIFDRRSRDSARKRPSRSADELSRQQELAILATHRAALHLRAPVTILISSDVHELVAALQYELEGRGA